MPFSKVPDALPAAQQPAVARALMRGALFTVTSFVGVTVLKVVAFDYIGPGTPFLLYFAPILLGAWFGGWSGGLSLTALSALAGAVLFVPPYGAFDLPGAVDSVRLAAFLCEGVTLTAIGARVRTQHRRTAATAREANAALAQFEAVLRGVADGITVQTPRGELRYANDAAAQMTGFASAREMLETPAQKIVERFELLEPDGSPFDVSRLPGRLALQGLPAPEQLVQFRVRATGQVRFSLVRATAVRITSPDGGEDRLAVNVFQDVTERRRQEEALRESREWLSTTLSSIGDAVIATDDAGGIRFMNAVAERLTGWTSAEAVGRPLLEVFQILDEATRVPVESPVARVLREGKVVGLANHTLLVARDGSETAIDDSAAPIRTPGAELTGTVLVFRDVSQRRAEERRRAFIAQATTALASSLKYRETLSTVVKLAVPVIGDWCAIDMLENGRFHRLAVHHVDPDKRELVRAIEERYPADPARDEGPYGVARTGNPVFIPAIPDDVLVARARNDEHLAMIRQLQLRSYIGVPLRVNGIVIGVLTLAMAESGRHFSQADLDLALSLADRAALAVNHARLYAEATAARAEAERANRAKDEFLAMLGHELRNPLAPILTALQLMDMREPGRSTRERAILDRQVKHLVRLVDDLLDVSRIANGKIDLAKAPVDLEEAVTKALELAAPLIEQRRHQVDVNLAPDLRVMGDSVRLVQAFTNLLSNAAKYSDPGGRIEIAGRREAGEVVLTVRDQGMGIPPELLPRVFELFVQGQQAIDRAKGGLGLGLAIVRTVVELHGGRVSAHSAGPDRGTEFRVVLPALGAGVVGTTLPSRASQPLTAGVSRVAKAKALIVDDNQDALELMRDALELEGYDVQIAADPATALVRAAEMKPDVALVDIGLPVMDGYQLAARLREIPGLERMKLVAVTGYGQAADKARAKAAGFDEHLVKPVSLDVLDAALGRLGFGLE